MTYSRNGMRAELIFVKTISVISRYPSHAGDPSKGLSIPSGVLTPMVVT
jgi:hypothetical protein